MSRLLMALAALTAPVFAVEVTHLRAEHQVDPVGLDDDRPRLTWRLADPARGAAQSAWEILAATTKDRLVPGQADLWSTGKVPGAAPHAIYAGRKLRTAGQVFWKVRVWDEDDERSAWSAPATWTCALMDGAQPVAPWISFRDEAPFHTAQGRLHLPPPRYYRRTFEAPKKIRRAIAFASALGIYELHCNGAKVGDAFFAPGWTNYRKRAYYNTYDLTGRLRAGTNAIGAVVADGWYAGYVGYGKLVGYGPHKTGRNIYGKTPALMVQLQIEFEDGRIDTIMTGPGWKVSTGPEFEADFLMGEGYDARKRLDGWCTPAFDASGWENAIPAGDNGRHRHPFIDRFLREEREFGFVPPPVMQAYPAQPVRVTQELPARGITEPKPGVHVFDLGQNIAGNVRLRTSGEAGRRITLRYGEMLHPDGRLMTENLRAARATDTYICNGDPAGETWTPRFTSHGFRYVEITGLARNPDPATVTGLVLHSDTPFTSGFECSDPVVNKIFHNAVWTQRGNWIDLPTDCPQRDERMGWCGDAQIYAAAAACHADVAAFFKKWLRELEDSMTPEGYYPSYAPYPFGHGKAVHGTAWSDAGIICPHALWMATGDQRFFTAHWPAMTRFMDARRQHDPGMKGTAFGAPWGDWLNVDDPTPHEYVDLCYFAGVCALMAEMAEAAGKTAPAERYRRWFAALQESFLANHLREDGRIEPSSQTAYILALDFGLVPREQRPRAAGHLAALIRAKAGPGTSGMTTGFLGTKPLLPVLSATGHHDLAVRLLQSRKFPSWGYEVKNGATTIWERWNSYTGEHGFGGPDGTMNAAMNSFSHYAFGAVTEWMMSTLAGIRPGAPGYGHIRIAPMIPSRDAADGTETISWVKAHHDGPHGRIAVHWKRLDNGLDLAVTIPPNTTATIVVPGGGPELTESGRPVTRAPGVTSARFPPRDAVVEVRAGRYAFEVRRGAPTPIAPKEAD